MAEKDRLRTKCVRVKLTDEEHEYFVAKAKSCGCTMSEYLRRIAKDGLIVKLETFDIKELSNELNHIGTNINQIAKHVNEKGGDYDKQDMDNLIEEFKEMQALIYAKVLGME